MRLFEELVIETQSTCNRACPTCLRQSYPDRAALAGRESAKAVQMPAEQVRAILDQAAGLGFRGWVCLQFFNEPLLDGRLAELGRYARGLGKFREVFVNTNGDGLTPEVARELDGAVDRLHVALYGGRKPWTDASIQGKAERAAGYRALFQKTRLTFTQGKHVVTHHWPYSNLAAVIEVCQDQPCQWEARRRLIVGYDGAMRLCCEDIAGLWDLGNIGEVPLRDLWFGERHREILETLGQPGGRAAFPYCRICPRPNRAWGNP